MGPPNEVRSVTRANARVSGGYARLRWPSLSNAPVVEFDPNVDHDAVDVHRCSVLDTGSDPYGLESNGKGLGCE